MSELPVMLYDGDCAFCTRWIKKWQVVTGNHALYFPYQEVLANYPQVNEAQCRKAVQLIFPDGTVFSAAHAVFKVLAVAGKYCWLLWSYEHLPLFATLSEWLYSL